MGNEETIVSILVNKTIRLFLDSIGRREEYEYYLQRFRADKAKAFALVCPLRPGLEDAASVLAFDLEFLLRLELDPVILLCGPEAARMQEILFAGVHPFAAFSIDVAGPHVDDPIPNVLEALARCRRESRLMVLVDPSTSLEDALWRLVPAVTRRVHFIRVQGPLHDALQMPLPYYYTRRTDRARLALADRPLGALATRLLNHAPGVHISVASPLQLLQELFTVKGAGCVVRQGSTIHRHTDIGAVDTVRLTALLEDGFERALMQHDFLNRIADFYIEEAYRGAALLQSHDDVMYLSKFAVQTGARGEGLAQELWRAVTAAHPALFWRSRERNSINHWYEKLADGHHRQAGWTVFWRGVPAARIPDLIEFALAQTSDFAAEV